MKFLPSCIIKVVSKLPLRQVLIIPFVLQVVGTAGLVGYLSLKAGQQGINDLANQLMNQVSDRVDQHLDTYLALPHQLNQLSVNAVETGWLDLQDVPSTGRYYWKQIQVFEQLSYAGYALSGSGEGAGVGRWISGNRLLLDQLRDGKVYSYHLDTNGNPTQLAETIDYDPLTDEWYVDAVKAGKPTWARLYVFESTLGSFVSASAAVPLYDKNQQLIGVLTTELSLSKISKFLNKLSISPTGAVFILERDGRLIANSVDQPVFKILQNGKEAERLRAIDSEDSRVQATARHLQQKFDNFQTVRGQHRLEFNLNGDRQFVHVTPWQDQYGLDWLVVTVVPESDFMSAIHANRRNTVLLCFAALVASIGIGIATTRWVIRPILRLNQAAKEIAAGNLAQVIETNRNDELGELADSFNQMAAQLQASFSELSTVNIALSASQQQLAIYNQTLEQQVQERTYELSQTLEHLKATQAELVQSEKMAVLGQLIAGIAHEVNTPLGAIQASIENISSTLEYSLQALPHLIETLSPSRLSDLFLLIDIAHQSTPLLSFREERQLKRSLKQTLNYHGIEAAEPIADTLSKMGISAEIDSLLPVLQPPDSLLLVNTAYHLTVMQNNSQNIRLAAERAAKLVSALKNYAHQNADSEMTKASVTSGIDVVLTLYHNQLKRGIEITKRYETVPPILCYPEDLMQVWTNLIRNAIQAMEYKGRLMISVLWHDRNILVEITDSGCGIPPEIQHRIFEPFFTTKPLGEGSGLGLDIVQRLVNKHQGKVTVESQPGQTTFSVWLPII
jgi:signal transduction histidine kinase